ncbi:hypothetical protein TSUD_200780 [Trifolium subterraneum]|uniref:Uncharacterized protein n=1 Tax=Trifolium subterraneum TaxID=3900 RepID=A0A2Z6LR84_TRISU|nr:hypothetical protein TSUD_200780 [Trifolium subterraneum]
MDSGNPSFYAEMLVDVEHDLLSDDIPVTMDENLLISMVNSYGNIFGCDRVEVLNSPEENIELGDDLESNEGYGMEMDMEAPAEEDSSDVYGGNPTSCMSRDDSYLNLCNQLPRIASLPRIDN